MQNDEAREEVANWILSSVPLTESAGQQLDAAVAGLATPVSAVGLLALVGFLWSSSGMMASVGTALDLIWGSRTGGPTGAGSGRLCPLPSQRDRSSSSRSASPSWRG
jgi:hypothetical protein